MCSGEKTRSGQTVYTVQMGHFFSGSNGSPGQIIGEWIIQFIFLKIATVDSEENPECLSMLNCH